MRNGSYELVKAPENYPGRTYRGKNRYVYEHHLMWWENTGQVVPVGFVVHHKNENKRDNRIENLELMSKSKHSAEHSSQRGEGKIQISCTWCGTDFSVFKKIFEYKKKKEQINFFCCRSHQVSHQHYSRVV